MATTASPDTESAQAAVSLRDRLVPSLIAPASVRACACLPLPPGLVRRAAEFGGPAPASPDTPLLAAWLVVMAQWLGSRFTMAEGSWHGGRWQDLQALDWTVPPQTQASHWLVEVAARRARPAHAPADASPQHRGHSPATADSLWIRAGSADLREADIELPTGTALVLALAGGPDAAMIAWYDATLTTPSQIQALLQATLHVAGILLDQPARSLRDIPLSAAPPPDTAASEAGLTTPAHAILTVHDAFTRQATARPGAIALSGVGPSLSYLALEQQAGALASRLVQRGVRPGDIVAVALDRSPAAITVLLAILKAGASYLPLDPAYPVERLAFMLDDAQAACIVTTHPHAALFGKSVPLLLLDDPAPPDEAAALAPRGMPAAADPNAIAYVMYTSGSTGTPKGIRIPHRAILRLVAQPGFVALSPDTAVLHAAPLGFDASTFEIWGPLLNGGRCVLHPEALPTGPGLARVIREQGVTTAWLTSALFNAVVDDDAQHLHGLADLLIGGEALSLPHVRRALEALPGTSLVNGYGPTECTTFSTTFRIPRPLPEALRSVPIGRPIQHTTAHVLGPWMQHLPTGFVGELFVGGPGVAAGYLHRPELDAQRFLPDPFSAGGTLYRTGDLVRQSADGTLEFIGRDDQQVKIRGFRIELGDIESAIASHPAIRANAVMARRDGGSGDGGDTRLVAYVVAREHPVSAADLRHHLARRLPDFMLPGQFVWLPALPVTVNGKLDRRALTAPAVGRSDTTRPDTLPPYEAPLVAGEQLIAEAFANVLGFPAGSVGRSDNFFELGGNSLGVLRVLARLRAQDLAGLSTTDFFRQPTPRALASALRAGAPEAPETQGVEQAPATPRNRPAARAGDPIAVIAMAGRFPGAADVEAFWANLCEGRESITHFSETELDPSLPHSLTRDPAYVRARGVLDDVALFDAAFFGISPKEAALMDPQQRIFLELCWECLERGGHAPRATGTGGSVVGIFAGMYNASYYQHHLAGRPDVTDAVGDFAVMLGNEKDYIATRVAHRLDLTGPAISVHTACSTSLVAVVQAMGSLRLGQCDMALAGGASITCPPRSGYLYQEGAMLSPDGRTRSFDAAGQGTVFSDGAGVMLLKRLADAQADGDTIYAVLRGGAINNDGRDKASFTAPSVDGQAAAIGAALRDADVHARTISYVEAHGTATPLGDPVEVAALTQAYRGHTPDNGFCAIGSLKSNVGHLVVAAGAAGLIKTALSLHEERLPPSLHCNSDSPVIDFPSTPFTVARTLRPWPRGESPRRAGVSSFGVGGTNAHVIVEEAPAEAAAEPSTGPQLLQLSARTPAALQASMARLADHLASRPDINLADVAHTLRVGRAEFPQRASIVAGTVGDAAERLRAGESPWKTVAATGARAPGVVFMFPGQGAQYAGMGRALYDSEPRFKASVDDCLAALDEAPRAELREALFSDDPGRLQPTSIAQPALFVIAYALAQTWLWLGVEPLALVGHSVGEFVAAALAGVLSPADAMRLVARRGQWMQALPPGAMLSVGLPIDELATRLPPTLDLAAHNAPRHGVVAGPAEAIERWRGELEAEGVATRLLPASHAFHSAMMEPAVQAMDAELRRGHVRLNAPSIPIVSTLTGERLSDQQATDPAYWARHLRDTVRFSPALQAVQREFEGAVLLELGPRQTLAALARQHRDAGVPAASTAVATLGDAPEKETALLRMAAGRLWALGVPVRTARLSTRSRPRRLRLPTYPFERQRFWIDALPAAAEPGQAALGAPHLAPPATALPTHSSPAPIPEPAMNVVSLPAVIPRQQQLVHRLGQLVEEVAGVELDATDPSLSFVEQGLDSLQLTQLALQIKRQLKVNVSFRQLMENLRTLPALAQHLDQQLPHDASPAISAPPAATLPPATGDLTALSSIDASQGNEGPLPSFLDPLGGPGAERQVWGRSDAAGAASPYVRQVIQQQMALMAQQLALLGASPVTQQASAGTASLGASAATTAPAALVPLAAPAPASTHTHATASANASTAGTSSPGDAGTPGMVRYDVKTAFGAIARIHTSGHEPLTERQQLRLDAFMRRYIARTQRSKDYTQTHRPHLADPRVVNGFRPALKEITYQIVIERSKGSRVHDLDGNEYIDVLSGFGMNMFGWSPDFVQEAVRRQLDLGYEIGPQHPLAGTVAQQVCELTGFDRAGLCNTGSEAVMGALRIARTVTGRPLVVIFTGSYHGIFDEVIVRGTRSLRAVPAAPGILPNTAENVLVLDYGSDEALRIIESRMDDIAAVLVEPVQSRRPDLQPREFLQRLRDLTRAGGVLFIFDEVVTGFRVHPRGAQGHFGIDADLATYGKVVGGGFPIGVIAGRGEFMDALDGGHWQFGDDSIPTVGVTYFAGTFVRHPLALAAAHAVLGHLQASGPALQQSLTQATTQLAQQLNSFFDETGAPLLVKHFGSVWKTFFLEDHPLQDLLFAMLRSRNVHILDNFPCFMTTAHSEADLQAIVAAFKESVLELQEADFLPRRKAARAALLDANAPPVPGARLGKDPDGKPAWYVPHPDNPKKFLKVGA